MTDFNIPDLQKYKLLPRNIKTELHAIFQKENGKALKPYLQGVTRWTPVVGTAFSKLVDLYHAYYIAQKPEKDLSENFLQKPQNLVNQ